eukprot:maker-scaffold618_size123335-snap-gene-0.22 protein:Tk08348 transcript:maker-scaffold618_size123335-snap-gene-0.22-mRNA-1 annotation:"hypothetical protein AaeL_AAEL009669"
MELHRQFQISFISLLLLLTLARGAMWQRSDVTLETSVLDVLKFLQKLPQLPFDPLPLWPVVETISKNLYRGKVETCDLFLHNIKTLEITHLGILRNQNLTDMTLLIRAHLPSVFVTGTYALSQLKYLMFSERNKMGHFDINLSNVDAEFKLRMFLAEDRTVHIQKSELDFNWEDTTINFQNFLRDSQSTRSKMTHLLLNELGVGDLVIQKQKELIQSLVDPYMKEMLRCFMEQPFDDINICMADLWLSMGFEYPFDFPECTIKRANYIY